MTFSPSGSRRKKSGLTKDPETPCVFRVDYSEMPQDVDVYLLDVFIFVKISALADSEKLKVHLTWWTLGKYND